MQVLIDLMRLLYETLVFLVRQWPITLTVILGLVGVYAILPRPRRTPWSLLGAVSAAGALPLLGGWLLIWGQKASPEIVLFYAFAGITVLFGALLVTQRNPVHAALSFAVVVLGTCGLFLLQAAPFLMAATIIVYAGAIVVTFLFVIMLAQQSGMSDADHRSREPFLSAMGSFVMLGALLYLLNSTYDTRHADQLLGRTDQAIEHLEEWVQQAKASPAGETDFDKLFADFDEEARAHGRLPDKTRLQDAVARARNAWKDLPRAESGEALANLQKALDNLKEVGGEFRDTYGNLQPRGHRPEQFSTFSGPPPNQAFHTLPRDAHGQVAMRADNVAALGQSLFTDYLVPVELAGLLLLVATVGAIAISGRRTGGLR